jgi:hypothetical protein
LKPLISKEYGAWASITTAFIAGIGIAGRVNPESLILLAGALSFFLARMPFLSLLRSMSSGRIAFSGFTRQAVWCALYFLTGVVLFSILLLKYKLTALFIFIVVSLIVFSYNIYVTHNKGARSKEASLSGALGVSFLSSFTYYAATGHFNGIVATLWILVFFYLAGGILYVQARLGSFRRQWCIVFQVVTMVIVSALGILGFVPMLTLVAYCPALIKSSTGVLAIDKEVVTRKLGRMELLHSAIYVFLIILIYYINPLKSGCERIGYCRVTQ